MNGFTLARLVRVWLTIAVVDFLFANCLSVFAYGSTFTRLWQGVASTVLGPTAFQGEMHTILVGVLLHLGVALAWSAVFLALATSWPPMRRILSSWSGILATSAVYGPLVWIVMSFAVIPSRTGKLPTVTGRWWIQLLGHIVFVGLPIVLTTARVTGMLVRDAGLAIPRGQRAG